MIRGFQEYLGRFVALTAEENDSLGELMEVRTFDRKARITDTGEIESYFNYIVKGLVRKYFYRGKEQVIKEIAKEGNLVSSSVSFLTGKPSKYIIETIEPSVLVSISRENLNHLFESGIKWERGGRLLMETLLLEKEYWLLDRTRYSPRERFLRFLREQPDLLQRVPQKYLASYLDIKPETFSRLKHLAQARR